MKKSLCLALASSSVAWLLVACGGGEGGETGGATAATSAESGGSVHALGASAASGAGGEQAALALDPASSAAGQPQWGELNAVYDDPHTWHRFTSEQVTVTDQGDVYVAWLSRHGGQTDVWVRQYSVRENRWLKGVVVAAVPDTAEGRIQDVQVVSVGNSVFAFWDFAQSETTFFSHGVVSTHLLKPAHLHFSMRTQGEETWSAAAPVPGVDSRPIGKPTSWKVAAAGERKLGVFWYASDTSYMASLFALSSKTWEPAQELGQAEYDTFNQWARFVPVFNRQGSGIVGVNDYTGVQPSFYLDQATGLWRKTPLAVHEGDTVIDEAGNVSNLVTRPGLPLSQLALRTFSATTGQASDPVTVYAAGRQNSLNNAQLSMGPKGAVLNWTEVLGTIDSSRCPDCIDPATQQTLRRTLPLASLPAQPQTLGQPEGPQNNVNWLSVQGGPAGMVSVWQILCSNGPQCDQLSTSFQSPQGNWSAPLALQQAWGAPQQQYVLKVNPQGQGVLIQARAGGSFLNTQLRVYASVLKK